MMSKARCHRKGCPGQKEHEVAVASFHKLHPILVVAAVHSRWGSWLWHQRSSKVEDHGCRHHQVDSGHLTMAEKQKWSFYSKHVVVVGDSWYCQFIKATSMEKQQSSETNMSQHASDKYLFFYRPHCLLALEAYMSHHASDQYLPCTTDFSATYFEKLFKSMCPCSTPGIVSHCRYCHSLKRGLGTRQCRRSSLSVWRFCLTWVWAHVMAAQFSRSSGKPKK